MTVGQLRAWLDETMRLDSSINDHTRLAIVIMGEECVDATLCTATVGEYDGVAAVVFVEAE